MSPLGEPLIVVLDISCIPMRLHEHLALLHKPLLYRHPLPLRKAKKPPPIGGHPRKHPRPRLLQLHPLNHQRPRQPAPAQDHQHPQRGDDEKPCQGPPHAGPHLVVHPGTPECENHHKRNREEQGKQVLGEDKDLPIRIHSQQIGLKHSVVQPHRAIHLPVLRLLQPHVLPEHLDSVVLTYPSGPAPASGLHHISPPLQQGREELDSDKHNDLPIIPGNVGLIRVSSLLGGMIHQKFLHEDGNKPGMHGLVQHSKKGPGEVPPPALIRLPEIVPHQGDAAPSAALETQPRWVTVVGKDNDQGCGRGGQHCCTLANPGEPHLEIETVSPLRRYSG
mmetsp:Transcript_23797/g.52393  ORF Transcript_23797/g.52393 Transcript_23797/m.52393 type:complete len:334 (+) Transcript_23797:1013-2014(+)